MLCMFLLWWKSLSRWTESCLSLVTRSDFDMTFFYSVVFLGVENQEAEPGARLTCHLLLRLLDESTDVMSHDHSSALKFPFKSSHDHHLLSAAHDSIRIGPVLAALKAMLKLSEAGMLYCSRSSSVCSFCSRSSVVVHVNERNSERAMLCFHDSLFFAFMLFPLCSLSEIMGVNLSWNITKDYLFWSCSWTQSLVMSMVNEQEKPPIS